MLNQKIERKNLNVMVEPTRALLRKLTSLLPTQMHLFLPRSNHSTCANYFNLQTVISLVLWYTRVTLLSLYFFGVVPNYVHFLRIDFSTIDHMTGSSRMFFSIVLRWAIKRFKLHMVLLEIVRIGTIKLTSVITIHDVLHVPNLYCNMLFISKFTCDHQCRAFNSFYCEF